MGGGNFKILWGDIELMGGSPTWENPGNSHINVTLKPEKALFISENNKSSIGCFLNSYQICWWLGLLPHPISTPNERYI